VAAFSKRRPQRNYNNIATRHVLNQWKPDTSTRNNWSWRQKSVCSNYLFV